MKEFKGTPGPWLISGSVPEEGVDCFWIRAQPHPAMRGFSKEIGTVNGFQHDKQAAANARLVAAAPELLEALMELRNLVQDYLRGMYRPDGFTLQPADHVIAKALGETE